MEGTKSQAARALTMRDELRPGSLGPSLIAGLLAGSVSATFAISFAALVFSGEELGRHLPMGLGFALFGGLAIGLVVAIFSSMPGMVGGVQENTTAILSLAATGIVATVAADQVLPTIVAVVVVASLLMGVVFFSLGYFRLGELVRFVPYPVVGGFVAGTGYLLIRGSEVMLTGHHLDLAHLSDLGESDAIVVWLPGVILAFVFLVVSRRIGPGYVVPGVVFGTILLFHTARLIGGVSVDEAVTRGWLLGPFPDEGLWSPTAIRMVADADWGAVVAQSGSIGSIVLLAVISVLLYSSGLELVTERDIDLNQELRAAGMGSMLGGIGVGLPGYHFLSDTVLAYNIAGPRRMVGVVAALVSGLVLLLGGSILTLIPTALVGSLVLFHGLAFIVEWVFDARRTLPRSDYALVLTILVAVAVIGFVEGVAIGVLIAIVLFIVNYSRIDVVKLELSGQTYRSNVDRHPEESAHLQEVGDQLVILQLQGYVFFGTANRILERVRAQANDPNREALRFLVFDFRLVSGLDSSAMLSFSKILRLAADRDIHLVFTGASADITRQLEPLRVRASRHVSFFADRDRGVQWCEDQILSGMEETVEEEPVSLVERLRDGLPSSVDADRLVRHFVREEIAEGEALLVQGEPSPGIYFVEWGLVTAYLEMDEGRRVRLRTMGPGTVIGEIGAYLGAPCSATVVTEVPTIVCRLDAEAFRRITAEDPEAAAAMHLYVARVLAERLENTDRTLRAVLK